MANIEKDLNYWINVGKEMTADREKRVNIARQRKFDTIATHGVYDLNQALSLNSGSIMEPIYLSTAQALDAIKTSRTSDRTG
jgi:O-acetylhomoserine (thiol)-lyase